MMRFIAVVTVLAAMAAPAHADDQDAWRGAFAGGTMVTLTGITMILWGNHQIDKAEHSLCTGDYMTDCGHPAPQTAQEVEHYNDHGQRAETIARVGGGIAIAGALFTVYAGYRGFRTEQTEVTIAPTATPTSAGAALTLRW
jgi:hypothetical protein